MNKIAGMSNWFDWVVGGPVRLYEYLIHFPIIFACTFIFSLIISIGFCSEFEGSKKVGYTMLATYFLTLMQWLIAHLIWKI